MKSGLLTSQKYRISCGGSGFTSLAWQQKRAPAGREPEPGQNQNRDQSKPCDWDHLTPSPPASQTPAELQTPEIKAAAASKETLHSDWLPGQDQKRTFPDLKRTARDDGTVRSDSVCGGHMTHHAGQRGLLLDAPGWERSSALAFRCSAPHATCDPAPLLRGPPSSPTCLLLPSVLRNNP